LSRSSINQAVSGIRFFYTYLMGHFPTRRGFDHSDAAADLEIGDTAGLETCATSKAARRMKRPSTLSGGLG
jgi:hypothetical protein